VRKLQSGDYTSSLCNHMHTHTIMSTRML